MSEVDYELDEDISAEEFEENCIKSEQPRGEDEVNLDALMKQVNEDAEELDDEDTPTESGDDDLQIDPEDEYEGEN